MVTKGLAPTRTRAQALIGAGKVKVDGRLADKAGQPVCAESHVEIARPDHPYVSRGGVKLAHAIDHFQLAVEGWRCLDVGASTGGFTDCLLRRGVSVVYAVDVGYGQLHWGLRNDPRVVPLERTNIRHLSPGALDGTVDLVTVDTSFISLRIVVPAAISLVRAGGLILALVKPQFEVGRGRVGKGGIVKDPALHKEVLDELCDFFQGTLGLDVLGVTTSPVLGAKGNKEFFVLSRRPDSPLV